MKSSLHSDVFKQSAVHSHSLPGTRSEKKKYVQFALNAANVIGLIGAVWAIYAGFKTGVFTDESAMRDLLARTGRFAPLFFIFIQIVQTVIPIIPGALTIPMGTMVFGTGVGFALNFSGIIAGSVINFALARRFGRPLVELIIDDKNYDKYIQWLDSPQGFDRLFTWAMFFPLSPDDFLCYFAGLSAITWRKYLTVLMLSKPLTLSLYQYGMTELLYFLFRWVG